MAFKGIDSVMASLFNHYVWVEMNYLFFVIIVMHRLVGVVLASFFREAFKF